MNRNEFLLKLFKMFPNTFNDNNISIWKEAYEQVLKPNWNYEKLFFKMVTNYPNTNTAPAPAYFKDFKKDVEPVPNKEQIESVEGVPPPKEFLDLKKKLLDKVKTRSVRMSA